ncbi:MAG: AAA family ATPase [Candidatus Diapherotrites archaeon]
MDCVPSSFLLFSFSFQSMHLIVTGTPGTGKTALVKQLARKLKVDYLNEKAFIQRHHLGRKRGEELEVDVSALSHALKKWLKTHSNAVLEGHLLCETPLKVDAVVVLTLPVKELEKRLRKRKYAEVKILDNVWAEKEHYCLRKAVQTFGKKRVFAVQNSQPLKEVTALVIRKLHRMGLE